MKILAFFFCLFFVITVSAQPHPQLRSHHDLKLFTEGLIQGKGNDFEKARVIYDWITDNIAYDIKMYNKGHRIDEVKCKKKQNCEEKKRQYEILTLEKVLRTGKAICGGYALLFKKMCDYAGVRSYVIQGYVRNNSKHAGNMGVLDHAWNAIEVGKQTYYLDVTWAAGFCDKDGKGKLKEFVRFQDDFYWLTPINKLTMDHYPRYPKRIPNFHIDRESYRNQPYVRKDLIRTLELCSPEEGIIKTCLNDTIRFKIESKETISQVRIFTNLHKTEKSIEKKKEKKTKILEHIPFVYRNGAYEFEIIVSKSYLRYIEVYFDKKIGLKYLVKVEV